MEPIAILLATYNGEKYIEEMLESLEHQTMQDFVCYIHDDGSTDDTVLLLDRWIKNHGSKYRRLEGESTHGAKNNFFFLMRNVEAQIYMFADQDDVWLSDKIEKTYRLYSLQKKKISCVFTDMYVVDETLTVLSDSFIRSIGRNPFSVSYAQIMIDNPAAGTTMMFSRSLRDKALECDDPAGIEMHDIWVLVLASIFGQVGVLDEPTVYYRQHDKNVMGAKEESGRQKIARNIKSVFTGSFAKEKEEFHNKEKQLARAILTVSDVPGDVKSVLEELTVLASYGKIRRIFFYIKHGFLRNRHNLWMLLWV